MNTLVTAVIIDDEQNNVDNLRALLELYCPDVYIIGWALDGVEGKELIMRHDPDIVFLDIQMPEISGFDLLQSLTKKDFELIFVTAFDQYGIQAVKFSAIDYLLKPINVEELKSAVKKAIDRRVNKKQNDNLGNLLQLLKSKKDFHRIALSSIKETKFINPHDIIRCESSNNYTTIFIENGEKIITSKPIYEYEEMLMAYHFVRCHNSHLINVAKIRSWLKEDGGFLIMSDNHRVPVSRQNRDQIKQWLSI